MQDLKCSSVFMFGVHELEVLLSSAISLFLSNVSCKDKTKINFALFLLLEQSLQSLSGGAH